MYILDEIDINHLGPSRGHSSVPLAAPQLDMFDDFFFPGEDFMPPETKKDLFQNYSDDSTTPLSTTSTGTSAGSPESSPDKAQSPCDFARVSNV